MTLARPGGGGFTPNGGVWALHTWQPGSYDDWAVADLRKRAAELEIGGRSSMAKSELIDALRHH